MQRATRYPIQRNCSRVLRFKRGVDSGFAIIKSKGDEALFGGRSTAEMKQQLGVPKRRALADRLADVLIKAKDLTNSMTAFNAEEHDLYGLDQIKQEHVENNTSVRGSLIDRGIVPENLPPAEDTKKLERRVKADEKKLKEGTDGFYRSPGVDSICESGCALDGFDPMRGQQKATSLCQSL